MKSTSYNVCLVQETALWQTGRGIIPKRGTAVSFLTHFPVLQTAGHTLVSIISVQWQGVITGGVFIQVCMNTVWHRVLTVKQLCRSYAMKTFRKKTIPPSSKTTTTNNKQKQIRKHKQKTNRLKQPKIVIVNFKMSYESVAIPKTITEANQPKTEPTNQPQIDCKSSLGHWHYLSLRTARLPFECTVFHWLS